MTAKILVVDDEAVTRRLVTFTLKALQVEVEAVENGELALQAAAKESFLLAFVDINLPDVEGFALVRQLHALPNMATLPIFMFTARNNADDHAHALEVGAVGFLYKPFSTQELRSLVTKYLNG